MERIFKFRVWDVENKIMLDWSQIWHSLVKLPREHLDGFDKDFWFPFISLAIQSPETKYIVQQFTGLKDKNSKEIYEGDILDARVDDEVIPDLKKFKYKLLVYWNNRNHTWATKTKNVSDYECETFPFRGSHYEILLDKSKVIGNIFETPELLTNI